MMSPDDILAYSRGIERPLIIGLSGLSLVLGWNLFKSGIIDTQTADFKSKDWTIRLQKVGPGIFFALFATATFIFAISRPLEIKAGSSSSKLTRDSEASSLTYAEHPADVDDRSLVRAINTYHIIVLPRVKNSGDRPEQAAILDADKAFEAAKKNLMFAKFGQMSTLFYQIHDKVPRDPGVLGAQSKEFQEKYPEMANWDRGTFVGAQ